MRFPKYLAVLVSLALLFVPATTTAQENHTDLYAEVLRLFQRNHPELRVSVAQRTLTPAFSRTGAALATQLVDQLGREGFPSVSDEEILICPDNQPSPMCALKDEGMLVAAFGSPNIQNGEASIFVQIRHASKLQRQPIYHEIWRVDLERRSGWVVVDRRLVMQS